MTNAEVVSYTFTGTFCGRIWSWAAMVASTTWRWLGWSLVMTGTYPVGMIPHSGRKFVEDVLGVRDDGSMSPSGAHPPPSHLPRTERSSVRRKADRGRYDWDTIVEVLDEALVCHVGFAIAGRPWVVPTAFARIGEHLYLHGAVGNFALRTLAAGTDACVTVTLLDALVLARSAFHHSMNYRSVMLFGRAEPVVDDQEKLAAVLAIVEHMVAGRSGATRPPTAHEIRSTLVVRLAIEEGSAKVRTGGPIEEPADYELPHWAGIIPLAVVRGRPQPDVASAPSTVEREGPG